MRDSPLQPSPCTAFRLSLACDLAEVRPAAQLVREFLAEQGLHEEEFIPCELAVAEACNNAIQYASDSGRQQPVIIEVVCNCANVELRVQDHTPGFDLPAKVRLPKRDSERGRGLFLIRTLMDGTTYLRGKNENALVMVKTRFHQGRHPAPPGPYNWEEAKQRLEENERVIRHMARELCFRSESLSAIFRCSSELGQTNNLENFSRRLLNDLLHITASDWFVLRLILPGEGRLALFAASEAGFHPEPLGLSDPVRSFHSVEVEAALYRRDVWFDTQRPLTADDPLSAMWPASTGLVRPISSGETLIGTLAVGKNSPQQPISSEQAEVVHTFVDFLALEIVNARLQEEQVGSRLVSHELEIARDIQQALLPRSLPQLRGLGLAGFCESAREVGGDFYDAIQLSEQALLLVVADVMGTGVPAAMFAAIVRSLVRAMPEGTRQPSELLARINRHMYEQLSDVDMFITAQLAFIDIKKRSLKAASAGHCPVLLAAAGRRDIKILSPEGVPLGVLPDAVFADETVKLGRHFRLVLYTDGITEACNANGDLFGQERLSQWLEQAIPLHSTADQLKAALIAELAGFQSGSIPKDDQTFMVLAEEGSGGTSRARKRPR
jgi:serine phosphatase RsbU (regulator of sigma subunit)/anti-sigma regulatory factor (Ser/Thr protein kinase)